MPDWTFITNHGLVLAYIAKYPQSTAREMATAISITERAVRKITAELEANGYMQRQRVGRNNVYRINPGIRLRHDTTHDVAVGDLLNVLGWRQPRKRFPQ